MCADCLSDGPCRAGVGLVTLPKPAAVFGFERGRVADRLGELTMISGAAPIRLHSPEGLGLAFVRVTEAKAGLSVGSSFIRLCAISSFQEDFTEVKRSVHLWIVFMFSLKFFRGGGGGGVGQRVVVRDEKECKHAICVKTTYDP